MAYIWHVPYYPPTPSYGVALLPRSLAHTYTPTGGITTGGHAPYLLIKVRVAAGGITTGGHSPSVLIKARVTVGGLTTGGHAPSARGKAPRVGATTILLGGTAVRKRTRAPQILGGIITGGVGLTTHSQLLKQWLASGGIVMGGLAVIQLVIPLGLLLEPIQHGLDYQDDLPTIVATQPD